MAIHPQDERVAEAYRILRSTVKFASGEGGMRSILVVDIDRSQPSGVAEGLAQAFVSSGDRCILLDLRSATSGIQQGPGFAELLNGASLSEAFSVDGNTVQAIGPGGGFSPDLLAGDRFPSTLGEMTTSGAFVVVACNSSPASADALAIAPRVDATLLVVSQARTRRGRAVETRDALERVGARILGVVLVSERRRWFW